MAKPLSEMTLDELWMLFPIQLTAHQAKLYTWYQKENDALTQVLPENAILHHIGSTAIPSIWAKPIIDILVEVDLSEFEAVKPSIETCGYLCMFQDNMHMDFNKGYTPDGFA